MKHQPGEHLILYDGDCGFCNRLVQFVLKRDPQGSFHFLALQDPEAQRRLDRYGFDAGELNTSYVLIGFNSANERLLSKAHGGLYILGVLGWPWRLLTVLRWLPTFALDWGYDWIARNRHRFVGRHDACFVPTPEQRTRFAALQRPAAEPED